MAGLMPLLLVAGLNLFFSSHFGTGLLEARLEKRMGLACEIEQVTWSPWAGLVIRKVRLLPPPGSPQSRPLADLSEIRVDLAWTRLMRGEMRWERVEFGLVEIDLSLEALKALWARYELRQVPAAPEVGRTLATGHGKGPRGANENFASPAGEKVDQPAEEKEIQRDSAEAPLSGEAADNFEGEVVFQKVNLRLYSEGFDDLSLELAGLSGSLPIWGAERQGTLALDRLVLGKQLTERDLTLPISWKNEGLVLEQWEQTLFGIDLQLSGILSRGEGFPVGLQLILPPQEVDLSPVLTTEESPVRIERLLSTNVLQGYLLRPADFRGLSYTEFEGLAVRRAVDESGMRFERGFAILKGTPAGILMEDARALGEEEAILMNGFVTSGGEAAATVRVVASPEKARAYAHRVAGASRSLEIAFQDLVTPDRRYCDLRLEYQDGQFLIDLGKRRQWVRALPVLGTLFHRENFETSGMQ